MRLISLDFWLFFAVVTLVYYWLPWRTRWLWLLASSILFFVLSCGWQMLPYLIYGVLVTYGGAWLLDKKVKQEPLRTGVYVTALLMIVAELVVLKYLNFFIDASNAVGSYFHLQASLNNVQFLVPIGISYYSLTAIGYLTDVYWEISPAQSNVAKHMLFICYFPQMTSGPVTRYSDMESRLFAQHRFVLTGVISGVQRMIWGTFKKMVIADRLAIVVGAVYADLDNYSGCYIIFAVLCFVIQLYTDFSGCMDIVLGASEVLGIVLPENFNSPFAAKNLAEFWRRWHITLGVWMRDFILYPVQKSAIVQKVSDAVKRRFGKKASKKASLYIGLYAIWLTVGFWHDADVKFIFLSGLLPGTFLVLEDILRPGVAKMLQRCQVDTESTWFKMFNFAKILIIMCCVWIFMPAASIQEGFYAYKNALSTFNPEIFIDGSLLQLGLTGYDYLLLLFALVVLAIVDYYTYHGIQVRQLLSEKGVFLTYGVIAVGIAAILLFGIYGPQYNPPDFIYKRF